MTATTDTFVRSEDFLTAEVDGETVLMHLDSGEYFALNPVGRAIWSMIDAPVDEDQIVEALLGRFEVDDAECRRAVTEFLEQLEAQAMVRRIAA